MKKQCLLVLLISTLSLSCSNINIPGVTMPASESFSSIEIDTNSESEKESINETETNSSTLSQEVSSSESASISISVTYDPNGGYGQMDPLLVDSYEFTLSENTFYKPGFNFVGWSLEPNGIIDYADCEEVYITEDTTLYAVYEYSSRKIVELIEDYSKNLPDNISDVVAFYGGQGQYDITKYIPSFIPELAGSVELQFGNLVYVGTDAQQYEDMTANFIPISQSYRNISDISLLDAYLELAFAYYYQGTQLQYDQGSSYQRKIRDMKPEDATELYQKYLDCSTYVSNAFYNAFGDIVIQNEDINSITTKVLIDYAKNNKNKSNEVVLYQDNLSSLSTTEKQNALKKFKENLQPGDLYVYRHTNDTAGHVMLYVGNDYFIHSTGASYNYSTLVDKVENYTSVQGEIKPEGSVRYQTASSTVYKESSTRYLFYVDKVGSDSNDRYAILRPLNRSDLKLTPTTIARCMMSGIEIEKSADKYTSVAVGDELTYTISIRNNSNKTIKNVSIKDEIPNNTSFVSMSRTDYFNILGNEMIWNIPSIEAKSEIKVSFKVKVTNDLSKIGQIISSTGSVGKIELNTLNISISSLSNQDLSELVKMALQYYDNENVYYSEKANNSLLDPTNNLVTFKNGASFITTIYNRYYTSRGIDLDLTGELSSVSNTNFMENIIDNGSFVNTSKLYSMMVHGGYGGTDFKKDFEMDRMRTVEKEYLLPGDIISFTNDNATNQYLYLGDITFDSKKYSNALLVFTTSDGVKMVYGSSADELLVKFIGYKCFAVIRPSLYC